MDLPRLPKISVGTSGFGNDYGKMSYGDCKQIIDKALINRINYIDTSPYYGNGLAEEMVGKCLSNVSRDRYIISTKAGRKSQREYSYRYYDIANSVMNSLKRLNCRYLDIVFINDIEFSDNLDVIINESIPALIYLKNQGYIKYIGLSSMFLDKMDYIIKRSPHINYVMSSSTYTLINNKLNQYTPGWNSSGIQVILGGVTSKGLLTKNGPYLNHPAPKKIKDVCKKMNDFCNDNNIDITEKAFYFSLGYKRFATILVGVHSSSELEKYITWLDKEFGNNKIFINTLLEMAKPIKNADWFF